MKEKDNPVRSVKKSRISFKSESDTILGLFELAAFVILAMSALGVIAIAVSVYLR